MAIRRSHHRRFAAVAVVGALSCGVAASLPAYADERSDLVELQGQQEATQERLQSQLEGIDVNLQQTYLQLEQTKSAIPIAEVAVQQAENELSAAVRQAEANAALLNSAQTELASIDAEIVSSEGSAQDTRRSLAELARATYRGEMMPSTLEVLFGSSTAEDFANAYRAQSVISRSQTLSLTQYQQRAAQAKNRQARQEAVRAQIEDLKAQSDQLVKVQKEKKDVADSKRAELAALEASLDNQSKQFQAQKANYQQSLAEVSAARDATAARIAQIDEENRRAAAAAAAAAQAQSQAHSSGSAGVNTSGSWIIPPIPNPLYVTSPFGMRVYPFDGQIWMHQGVDLRSPCGQAQVAAADGVVSAVIPAAGNSTHGNQVYINHGIVNGSSWVTVSNHMSGFNVVPGQSVRQGDVIGWTGATGMVTGCHVHFEVWRDGQVLDPMTLSSFVETYN
ncbi:peptidoglycan DD-metalloendopeptidase family protein [Trueperella sp. LYQ143]|uniref:peptidoglycan DD-metalloendopeptidase family protein n=1 Tax=unclassified Trueperella TaxID=2630174 RepID=UPI0039834BB3